MPTISTVGTQTSNERRRRDKPPGMEVINMTNTTNTTKTREQVGRELLEAKLAEWLKQNPGGSIKRNA